MIDALTKKKGGSTIGSTISRVTEWVPTGCTPLDICMGGGNPVGRMVEIYGDTSTGKSLLASHIIAEAQAAGGIGVLFDTESAASEHVMKCVGVDIDELLYYTPETIEELYGEFEALMLAKYKHAPDDLMVIVWDSVAATSTLGELKAVKKKGMGAATMGIHARLISQLCRIVNVEVAGQRLVFIFVNQTRQKIGVMFGSDVVTFGGKAIGFYSSIRLEMKHLRRITDDNDDIIGIDVRVGISKNKVAKPFRQCEFPIIFDHGIDEAAAMLWWLRDRKLVTGAGWKVLELLDGTEIKFQHSGWENVYWENESDIIELAQEEN